MVLILKKSQLQSSIRDTVIYKYNFTFNKLYSITASTGVGKGMTGVF